MGRTKEEPIPVEETYRDLLRKAVDSAGGQRSAARLAHVSQPTISRALERGHPATYTTLAKMARAFPGIPSPVVPVRDATHEEWCRLGADLAALKPATFAVHLDAVRQALAGSPVPSADAIERLRRVVAIPVPGVRARRKSSSDD